jgi:predicted DNA-binding protein YlxM (UPF0122 family)
MKNEQQQQAQRLYFQTDLSKTQIAESIGVSRRAIHYWIRENEWERLKQSTALMPAIITENCYHLMSEFTEHLLSPERAMSVTAQEINSLYKLSQIIGKLKSRSSVNESIETLTNFMEVVSKKSPELVDELQPCVSEYLTSRARVRAHDLMADKFREPGRETITTTPEQDAREAQLDLEDILAWYPKEQAAEASPAKPTGNPAPAPKPQPAASPAPPKYDLRKALRGTATFGPGKSFRKAAEKAVAA